MTTPLECGDEVYAIVGAAMTVYNELGSGFLEAVYQEALELELADRGIPCEAQKPLAIRFKGKTLHKTYCADLFCFGKVIVELKVLQSWGSIESAQLLNYLKASGLSVGVLLNFGAKDKLEWKRFIY
jgi:GxxExxY protein